MEFFRGKTLIFKEFFRGEQIFHGIFREKSTFLRISSGVGPFLREVFRGECSLVEFFRGKKKSYFSTGGADIKCNSPKNGTQKKFVISLDLSTLYICSFFISTFRDL